MRSSSIKTAAIALTVALTLTTAAPTASARTTRSSAGTPVLKQFEEAATRATTAARRLLTRFFGPVANALPSPPLPVDTSLMSTETEETTTTSKTSRKP